MNVCVKNIYKWIRHVETLKINQSDSLYPMLLIIYCITLYSQGWVAFMRMNASYKSSHLKAMCVYVCQRDDTAPCVSTNCLNHVISWRWRTYFLLHFVCLMCVCVCASINGQCVLSQHGVCCMCVCVRCVLCCYGNLLCAVFQCRSLGGRNWSWWCHFLTMDKPCLNPWSESQVANPTHCACYRECMKSKKDYILYNLQLSWNGSNTSGKNGTLYG